MEPYQKDDEMIYSNEDVSEALNDYYLSVLTHENLITLSDADRVFRGKKHNKLNEH